MCIIVDTNCLHEVFGRKRTEAGKELFRFIDSGKTELVIGGRLLKEVERNTNFLRWFHVARNTSSASLINEDEVNSRESYLESHGLCKSDDPHVIALAQCANARLLYSKDQDLCEDFTNSELIKNPRGRLYPTSKSGELTPLHREILNDHACPIRMNR